MAKKKSKPAWVTKLQSSWLMLFGLAAVLLLVAYGFASWAIDSGNLLHYALAIIFLAWGIKEITRGVKVLFHK